MRRLGLSASVRTRAVKVCPYSRRDVLYLGSALHQARNAATEALKLLTVLSRPTVKAAGQLQKRLVIEDGGHNREQVRQNEDCTVRLLVRHPGAQPLLMFERVRLLCIAPSRPEWCGHVTGRATPAGTLPIGFRDVRDVSP